MLACASRMNIRRAVVAGSWYPGSRSALAAAVDRHLAGAESDPPVGGDQGTTGEGGQQMLASVQTAMKQARENPNDFEAQLTAAKLEYQIGRYDQAIEYLLAANKIKPKDFGTMAMLGVANLDASHFDASEKWYRAALEVKPDDMPTLDGLCAALLSKGDAKGGEEQINKLAKIDPNNQDLPQFREKLSQLKSGKTQ